MRKIILAAAIAGTALTLSGCSESAEEATTEDAMAEAEAPTNGVEDITAATVLDANLATAEQLATVDGVSPELAEAIVTGRPYASVVDLNAALLKSLSQDEASAVLVKVFVPVNLDTGSEEELRLIPGMTDRMVHEFEEYRPYENMAEFDREIGKYVDEAEVARFRNYVTL